MELSRIIKSIDIINWSCFIIYAPMKEEIKAGEASEMIHALAKVDSVSDLPAASTIEDELNKIKKKAEKLSIK